MMRLRFGQEPVKGQEGEPRQRSGLTTSLRSTLHLPYDFVYILASERAASPSKSCLSTVRLGRARV
jgi:hypothetical protein